MKNNKFNTKEQFLNQKPFKIFKSDINKHSMNQIENIIAHFDKKYILNNRKEVIQNMLKYNVSGDWVDRLISGEKLSRDGFSMEALVVKYGGTVASLLFKERTEKVKTIKENYTEDEWKSLCNKKKSNLGLKGYIDKYGITEGTKRWNSYYSEWKNSMDKTTALGNRKNGQTLVEYRERYGYKKGFDLWRRKIDKRNHTLSLGGFVERYGNERGKEKYFQHIQKMIENCRAVGSCYSKISQKLFNSILIGLDKKQKLIVKYYTLNEEQVFYTNYNSPKLIYVDFKCGNCIIEFDGEYWHSFTHAIKRDKFKDKYLKSHGYKILRVKEREYINNKQQTIDKCIKFIKENYERTQS